MAGWLAVYSLQLLQVASVRCSERCTHANGRQMSVCPVPMLIHWLCRLVCPPPPDIRAPLPGHAYANVNKQCTKLFSESENSHDVKNCVFWVVTPCGSCKNRRTLRRNTRSVRRLLVAACVVPSSPILVTLMKEGPGSSETSVLT
jgi:hypothetical protein